MIDDSYFFHASPAIIRFFPGNAGFLFMVIWEQTIVLEAFC